MADSLNKIMDNPLVIGGLAIALTVYGPRLSPKLPSFIHNAFQSDFFRFIIILLVIFVGSRNIRLAIVVALLFLIITSISNQQSVREDYNNQVKEYYANYNLFKLGNIEHFDTAVPESAKQPVAPMNVAQPQKGNDVQNDTQGLDDTEGTFSEIEDDAEDDSSREVTLNAGSLRNEFKQVVSFVNNPKSGMTNKCRSYWNAIYSDSDGCSQELEAKIRDNPQLVGEINAQVAHAQQMNSGSLLHTDRRGNLKEIERRINQACAAFRNQ